MHIKHGLVQSGTVDYPQRNTVITVNNGTSETNAVKFQNFKQSELKFFKDQKLQMKWQTLSVDPDQMTPLGKAV